MDSRYDMQSRRKIKSASQAGPEVRHAVETSGVSCFHIHVVVKILSFAIHYQHVYNWTCTLNCITSQANIYKMNRTFDDQN